MPALQRPSGRSPALKTAGRTLLTASRATVAVTLVVAPLLWGGRHPMALGVTGLMAAVAALLWAAGVVLRGRWTPVPARGLWLLLPVLAVLVLQLVPHVFAWWPAPELADLWAEAARWTDVGPARFAVRPEGQTEGVMAVATAALVYWLSVQLFCRRQRVLWLVAALALAGSVTAVAGLCQAFGHWDWFLWLYKGAEKTASAGYFNRDHFAQVCALTVFVSLGFSVAILTAPRGSRLALWAAGRRWLGWGFAAGAVAALLAVMFSYSRAAILVTVAGIVLFATFLVWGHGKRTVSVPAGAVALALFIASFYGLDVLTERLSFVLSGTDPSALVRREIWGTVKDVIVMSLWFGSGWEGVRALAPMFDTSYVPGYIVNAAHNDYLELAVIVGLPLAVLVGLGGLIFYVRALRRTARLGHRGSSYFPLALGLGIGLLMVLCHEFVEYGLKQPANLCMFVVAAAAWGLVLKTGEAPSVEESRQDRLTVTSCGLVAVVGAAAVGLAVVAWPTAQVGWVQAQMEGVICGAAADTAISERTRASAAVRSAERVLALDARNEAALTAEVEAKQTAAVILRRETRARALSVVLERTVTARQAENAVYERYQAEAFRRIPEVERRQVAAAFAEVRQAALRLATLTPSNALALSMAAAARDEVSIWTGTNDFAAAEHARAEALYPTNTTVLTRAVKGWALAYAATDDVEEKSAIASNVMVAGRMLASEVPETLKWLLPLTAMMDVTPEATAAVVVVPNKIRGQELYAEWLSITGQDDNFWLALRALEKVDKLNNARLDDEKPWTMGRAAYLAREKRDKTEVAQDVDRLRLEIYRDLADKPMAAEVSERMQKRETRMNDERVARADELMAKGDWVLAEELLKRMPRDPRALVRRAEMALTMNRLEGAGQRLQEFEAVAELADEETVKRAEKSREQLTQMNIGLGKEQ